MHDLNDRYWRLAERPDVAESGMTAPDWSAAKADVRARFGQTSALDPPDIPA
jgi:hypothetical protein